jgi:hypothetical protein
MSEQIKAGVLVEEPKIVEHEVQIPAFPRLLGPLGKLADAITPDIPYDFKALSIITCVGLALSGRIRLVSDPWLQTRFYSLNIGTPGTGKSAAGKEVSDILGPIVHYAVEYSMDSGPALVEALSGNNRLLLLPDEMADQFEKAKTTGTGKNSLFGEWLRLFEQNTTGNRTKKDKRHNAGGQQTVTDAHFAMVGGVTAERNPSMWQGTGGTKSGLRSRICPAYSEQVQPRLKTPNNAEGIKAALAELDTLFHSTDSDDFYDREPKRLFLTQEAQEAILAWRIGEDTDELFQRSVDMAKRFALLNAFCAGKHSVDAEAMRLGLDFTDYRIAVMKKLFEPDAANYVQAFENRIIAFFTVNPRATLYQVMRQIRPEKYLGGFDSFNRAWSALAKAEKMVRVGSTRKKQPIFEWQTSDEKAA